MKKNTLFINEAGVLAVSKGANDKKSSFYKLTKDPNGNYGIKQNENATKVNQENVKEIHELIKKLGR